MIWSCSSTPETLRAALSDALREELSRLRPHLRDHEREAIADGLAASFSEAPGPAEIPADYVAYVAGELLSSAAEPKPRWPGSLSPTLWRASRSGLFRVSPSALVPSGPCAVIDLARLRMGAAQAMDLSLLPALRVLVECAAGLWDESGGRGLLGLRNTRAAQVGDGTHCVEFCRALFHLLRARRGWATEPRALCMDLYARRKPRPPARAA